MLFRNDKKDLLEIVIELDEIDRRLNNVGAGRGIIPEHEQLNTIRKVLQECRNNLKELA